MDTIVFDIDGTLSDVTHRRHFVKGANPAWGPFFDAMVDDPPLADTCLLAELLGSHPLAKAGNFLNLFFFSGRPETHRKQTEDWLKKHVPVCFERAEGLLMRGENDFRPDTIIKREMLQGVRNHGFNVRLVIDDRPSVVQMWKDEGITVLAHDSGEWEGVEKPRVSGFLNLMVGPSGGGKSHYIKTHFNGPASAVISTDALRNEITGDFRRQDHNDQVFFALHAIVKARVESGLQTVVDATNLHARDRRKLRDLVPVDGCIGYIVMDRPLAEKHRDAGWRDEVVINGVKLIDKHHKSFKSGLKHILAGDADPRVVVTDGRSM